MRVAQCPRCFEGAYEIYSTHACCLGCNYSPDLVPYYRRPICQRQRRFRKGKLAVHCERDMT